MRYHRPLGFETVEIKNRVRIKSERSGKVPRSIDDLETSNGNVRVVVFSSLSSFPVLKREGKGEYKNDRS